MRAFLTSARGLAVVLLIGACNDAVIDPFSNDGKYFSVYGFIDELETNHVLRVIPVTRRGAVIFDPSDPNADIDARVTTTDLETGDVYYWSHHIERLADGTYGHIYRSNFRVRPNRTYRLEILRVDGKTTWAETRIPNLSSTRIEAGPPILAADATVTQQLLIPGVRSVWDVEILYRRPSSSPIRLPYGRDGKATDDGWTITLDITRDILVLASIMGLPVDSVSWAAMGIKAQILDNNWDPPLDVFDPEVLAQPGTLSNVENGYGFWGSIGLFQDDWPNSPELEAALGF